MSNFPPPHYTQYPVAPVQTHLKRVGMGKTGKPKSNDNDIAIFAKVLIAMLCGVVAGFICSDMFTYIGPAFLQWLALKLGGIG